MSRKLQMALMYATFALAAGFIIAVTCNMARGDEELPPCGWWNNFCAPKGVQPFSDDDKLGDDTEPPADGGGTPPPLVDPGPKAPNTQTVPKGHHPTTKPNRHYDI